MAQPIELTRMRTADRSHFLTEDPPSLASPVIEDDVFPGALTSDDADLASIHPPWKRRLHALLERPKSSGGAMFLHMLVTFLILTSALVTVLETIPTLHEISVGAWFGAETMLVALFTIEYGASVLWDHRPSGGYAVLYRDPDAPGYFGAVSVFDLADVPAAAGIPTVPVQPHDPANNRSDVHLRPPFPTRPPGNQLLRHHDPHGLQHPSVRVYPLTLVPPAHLSSYFAERGSWDPVLETFVNVDGDPTQFSSIPAAAWFVLVTITTVGYGEITPRSFLGRLITLPILVFGLLLITLPSFVLGREFSIVWEQMTARQAWFRVVHSLHV
ncbi:hypothetical protein C0989_009969 [Termitomyces sp. Mn162]|nr:hypothetical protein C0989_009969 [Termitomyces sp. Mn162]